MNKLHTLFLIVLFAFTSVIVNAQHLVISEFATRGSSAATDEFCELYNPTDAVIDLSGWKLEYKSATGTTWLIKANIPAGKTIPSHGYFLIAPTSYIGNVLPDYVPAEWNSGNADNGHLHIINAANTEIDKVGWGNGSDPEGCPAPNHGTSANNNSVERKAYTTSTSDSL
ncbi:MAG: lamin tail domain-containing protein, partial [Bacteroidota bacterium]